MGEHDKTSISRKRQKAQVKIIRFLLILLCLSLVAVGCLSWRVFHYKSTLDDYDQYFLEIESRDEAFTHADYEEPPSAIEGENTEYAQVENGGNSKAMHPAAEALIDAFNADLDTDDLPESVTAVMDEINRYYRQNNNYFAFAYKDLYTGFTVTYNPNQSIYAASTVKAPADIYLYEQAAAGNLDLNETMVYTKKDYHEGSGVIRYEKFGTQYTVRKLIEYSVIHSDNVAHCMLMAKYGRSNMLAFWRQKGTNAIFTMNTDWGVTSAHDALIYMQELYDFYLEDQEYGNELMNRFLNTKTKFIVGTHHYPVANKGGWDGSVIHDAAIVFAENPYIVVALSNLYNTSSYEDYFDKVNQMAYSLHTAYWKYKTSLCTDVAQYQE